MLTNKEIRSAMMAELKKAGYSARAVSVSVRDSGYSTAARVTVKSPLVSCEAVRQVLGHWEEIDRDKRTGEILAGANMYLFIDYAPGIFDEAVQEWTTTARGAWESKDETTRIFDGLYLLNLGHAGRLEVIQQNNCDHCRRFVNGFNELCVYLYKFATFGSIVA